MRGHDNKDSDLWRERAIHSYIRALDQGDIDTVAAVVQAALNDSELDRLISEVNLAYQDEELEDRTGPVRIVLVDDHDLARESLRDMLTDEPDIEVVGEA